MAALIGGATPRLASPSRFGLLHTTRLFTEPYAVAGGAGNTFLLQTGSEAPFDWVRLVYSNIGTSPFTIGGAAISPSREAPTNGYSAYNADGTARSFTAVTFNAGGAAGLPPSPAGSTATLVVPPQVAAGIPSVVFSDWMQVSSIAPSDGGTFHYLLCRTYVSAGTLGGPIATPVSRLTTDFPTIAGGRKLKAHYSVGDLSQVPNSLQGNQGYVCPVAVQFYSRKRGMAVLDIGDSLTEGYRSTSDHNGPGFQAVRAVSTPAFPVFYANHGYAGQASQTFTQNGRQAIDTYAPDVALLSIFSPNDGTPSQASVDASFARALDLAHYCMAKGTVPIVKTALPYGGTNATTDAFRLAINARARALAPGILVADLDAAVTDGASPARLRTGTDSGDGTHPNDAGYAACASMIVPILARLAAFARAA